MDRVQLVLDRQPIPSFDFHSPLMSLPLALGTTLATIPSRVPYLFADSDEVEYWRKRLAAYPGRKIGLVWSGGTLSVQNITRSMPLSDMRGLAGLDKVTFVSLQKGEPAAQAPRVPELSLLDWTAELRDMSDTAALICALDQVISVCTSVAHLSGALGRPTWTLLAYAADFRWMLDRQDSPWYPTMRLFRQTAADDWPAVIARVRQEVTQFPGS
jgi:ADP-heptose:LPS heptosyltransferase